MLDVDTIYKESMTDVLEREEKKHYKVSNVLYFSKVISIKSPP